MVNSPLPPRVSSVPATSGSTSESAWETQIERWEQPASASEEATIERAARMVREALATNPWFASQGVTVAAQGSYFNNTNVRLQADMDIRVVHPIAMVEYDPSMSPLARIGTHTFVAETPAQIIQTMRTQIEKTLETNFGRENIDTSSGKAVLVKAVSGSRSDLDVLPSMAYDYMYVVNGTAHKRTGIALRDKNSRELIYNYPQQHYQNGVQKRTATGLQFKKIVRSVKSIRDKFSELGILVGKVPSFLIESLIFNVEDVFFLQNETRRQRLLRILLRLDVVLGDNSIVPNLMEINGWKFLFRPTQPWNLEDAQKFVKQAIRYLST